MDRELIVTGEVPPRNGQRFIADHRVFFADPARCSVTGVTL
jgi:hypothetical protein